MDTDLVKLLWRKGPKPIQWLNYSPYFKIRFTDKQAKYSENSNSVATNTKHLSVRNVTERVKLAIRNAGLMKYFEPYRPYEFYRSGPIIEDVIETAKSVGFQYMFTKAGFNSAPQVKYLDNHFIALNYTAGQWDGWTPFETINDISDLRKTEKKLHKNAKPGWIVSTIDSCLWTFSGEFWKRGSRLYDIAEFCVQGGKSNRLINVKPFTISRYARILSETG
jgi:hypothetical protein